ncbi:MAG: hypothetical protein KME30_25420 [Iphinoe sp. HA4291-MV1]|nr:hypothetical protein [Iphinoe sp. HA4291-MV1]
MNKVFNSQDDEMLDDYSEMLEKNWSRAVRGKYYNRYPKDRKPIVKITSEEGVRYVTLRWLEAQATVISNSQIITLVPSDILPGEHLVTLLIKEPVNLISEELIPGEENEQEVTIKTFKAEATVTSDGKLTAQLDTDNYDEIAPGEYKVTLIIEEPTTPSPEETSNEQ